MCIRDSSQVFDADGRKVFVVQKYVKLSHDLRLTIIAKDKSGADLTTGFTIVTKGKQPTPSTPPTGSESSTSTSTATDTTSSTATNTNTSASTTTTDPGTSQAGSCYKAPDDFTCQVELEITRLTNEKRAAAGLGELTYDKNIAYVSRLWSAEQSRRMTISHEWFETGVWTQQYNTEFGQPYTPLAENVAQGVMGSDAMQVAASLMDLWWNSEPHKANILNPGVTVIGVGFAANQSGMTFGTQNFGNR